MTDLIFWTCIIAATYSYFWYPALLLILPPRRALPDAAPISIRRIAIVIAARNEASKIAAKLDNTLTLEREDTELDIVVASDASDDGTDSVVLRYADKGVRLIRSPTREGKEHAQGLAIASIDADVIVFTDVGTILPKDALIQLLDAFTDPTVGAVSSVDRFITSGGVVQGEGAYVRYEMWLRDLETRFYSLVGLSGSFFAARRSVCQNWDSRVQSDFGTALSCVKLGMRAISDKRLIGYYKNIVDGRKEYSRKVRTVTRGMNSLRIRAEVLNAAQYGRFSFEVISHKVMRWATPWFLLAALAANIDLAMQSPAYRALLAIQLAFYLTPIASQFAPGLRKVGLARIAIYFVEVNVAILHASVLALSGRTILTWEPSKR